MPEENQKPKKLSGMSSPQPMVMNGNLAQQWKKWVQSFKFYLRASGLDEESDGRKVALFLHVIGEKGVDVFNTFGKDEDNIKYNELIKLFQDHFAPKANLTYECHNFFTYKQGDNETLDDFACTLKLRSQNCELGQLQERLVKIMFICNMHQKYNYIREKLLLEDKLDLDKALEMAKAMLASRHQTDELTAEQNSVLYNMSQSHSRSKSNSRNASQNSQQPRQEVCTRCGQVHRNKCPAFGVKCRKCEKIGHFAVCCRSFQSKSIRYAQSDSNTQQVQSEQDELFIGHIQSSKSLSSEWTINLYINNSQINCIIDTGSDVNIMSKSVYDALNIKNSLSKTDVKIKSYTGNSLEVIGQQNLECKFQFNDLYMAKQINFIIANVNSPTVLGKLTCSEIGLIKRVFCVDTTSMQTSETDNSQLFSKISQNESNPSQVICPKVTTSQSQSLPSQSSQSQNINLNKLVECNNSVFTGLGCLPGECHINTNPEVQPKIDAPRKVPFALHHRLQQELEKMEKMDVITKVTEPTEWVNSLILIEKKNGQLRVCLDPRNLNQAIKRTHYPIPSVDVVRAKVAGARFYSTLDATSGFWMCKLSEKSSYLTTFNTPFGRYRFKRLPYGVSCAPEYFHRIMTEMFGDIPGVAVYSDDILVSGQTLQEHNERLNIVFKRAKKYNVKFNKEKCSFTKESIKYLGHIFSADGITADSDKVRAIKEMPSPTCLKDLQRFLGLLNYLSPFIKNMAGETEILRQLLKKSTDWQWTANHETAFCRLKQLICQVPVLAHFNVHDPIVLQSDASKSAVGAVLLQNQHPVYYASKTLTDTQQKMAQIEKELYSIVFACIKFHQFIYGQTVTVETDHAPLITLFKKSLVEVPTRLQRMMLKIQPYSLNVVYKKGSHMYIADTLSRAALSETSSDELDDDIIVHVNLLIKSLPVSSERLQWLIRSTNEDENLQILKKYCKEGWPSSKNQIHKDLHEYWQYRFDLHTENDLIFRNNSIVIPKKLRPEILKIIHSGHLGIERSKAFARGHVFWPFMSTDIKNIVQSCHICLSHRNSNAPEPLLPHDVTLLPWEKVGVDFMDYKSKKYIVVQDYYSNYIELMAVASTNAKTVIVCLKSIFSRHGIPVELFSDNGPPFNSAEFKNFIWEWGIHHNTSSPYIPRSNGLVESAVKICKRFLTKSEESGTDPYLALLQFRNTPRGNLPSPAQLLMSRSLRTQLPTVTKNLIPRTVNFQEYVKIKEENKNRMKDYYDRKTKPLPELQEGDEVYFKKMPDTPWITGTVRSKCDQPRSYTVEGSDGFIGRRNRQHILKPQQSPQTVSQDMCRKSPNIKTSPNPHTVAPSIEERTTPVEMRTRCGRVIRPPRRLDL